MNAWLVTWEWMSESAEVADRIATILPSRWSPARVSDVVQNLYDLSGSNLDELASIARNPKNNPYKVKAVDNHADMLAVGAHPWLYARKVSKFSVHRLPSGFETASWLEPNRCRMRADGREIEIAHVGVTHTITRAVNGILSQEAVWDRLAGRRKPQFVAPVG